MTGEFSHHPDNQPMPRASEIEPTVAGQFRDEVDRLALALASTDNDRYGMRWYKDVVHNSLIQITREVHPLGRNTTDVCRVDIYESPEDRGSNTQAQIRQSFLLDLLKPSDSCATTDLDVFSKQGGGEVYDPGNLYGMPNPDELGVGNRSRIERRMAQMGKEDMQLGQGIHASQMPHVGTTSQEFADIIPVLKTLEESNLIEEKYIHYRPVRLVPEKHDGE